jgi:hypothetical protein
MAKERASPELTRFVSSAQKRPNSQKQRLDAKSWRLQHGSTDRSFGEVHLVSCKF